MYENTHQEPIDDRIGAIVLLVEDDPDDVHVIRMVLEKSPVALDLQVVANGREAIAYLEKCLYDETCHMPDLVLLDLNMPMMDGTSFLKAVRAKREISALPICVFTTSTDDDVIRKAYEAGANMVVNKVDTLDDMRRVLDSIVDVWFKTAKRVYI